VWDVKVNICTSQQNLIITESGRPVITVDRRKTIEAVKVRRRAYYRDYKRLRKQYDPAFKLIEKLRPELSAALIGKIKSIGLKSLLGCSVAELRQHFEVVVRTTYVLEKLRFPVVYRSHQAGCDLSTC
jgi:hypothetical protein